MSTPEVIHELVDRFATHRQQHLSGGCDKMQLRREFVDPLFKALGWDVDNARGSAEASRDVTHWDSIRNGGVTGAPDYCFRIAGTRRFFVKTKKPGVTCRDDASAAFQLRRYVWSARLPLSILTNFAELVVYDCRARPAWTDKASAGRTLCWKCGHYGERWDEIASLFSRDAVLGGSLEKYAESTNKKRGADEVDAALLKEIEQWRKLLAHEIALHNSNLSQRELNTAVGKTIDRILFLRICEDRGVERYGRLQSLANDPRVYARLCQLFREADDRYNSGLFHFYPDKDRTQPPDAWTLGLEIGDRTLKEIIRKLYYPESPYEFSVLGADILGQVYEQFLGKTIRLTGGHRVTVEDKPDVKKTGGVYYTPTYVVDYIVRNTVGRLLEGKTPFDAAGRTEKWNRSTNRRPLTVLDPACGSGSFLIGAYQFLLDWYRDWYAGHDPARHKQQLCQTRQQEWRLTVSERKRILSDHIYGVDIDPQAVEVTKLSLLLKVLEGETAETLQRHLFAKQRALPDLAGNIKCGNSLIGPGFYENRPLESREEEEMLRFNAFDWRKEFPAVFDAGGFDAIIGNPPYVKEYTNRQVFRDLKKGALARYYAGKMDLWYVFACLAVDLLRRGGLHSFIATNNWVTNSGARVLRRKLRSECEIEKVVDFGPWMVFKSASIQTMIYVVRKSPPSPTGTTAYTRVSDPDVPLGELCSVIFNGASSDSVVCFRARLPDCESGSSKQHVRRPSEAVETPGIRAHDGLKGPSRAEWKARSELGRPFTFVDQRRSRVLEKIAAAGELRLQPNEIAQGIVPNPDVVSSRGYARLPASRVRELGLGVGDPVFVVPSDFFENLPGHELRFLKPTFGPAELDRYRMPERHFKHMIYLTATNDPGNLVTLERHLSRYREIMEDRRENKTGRIQFKHLHWPRDERFFSRGPKILCVRKCRRPVCVYTERPAYVMLAINVIRAARIDLKVLTALLNSRLIFFWLDQRGKKQGDQLQIDKEPLTAIPLLPAEACGTAARKVAGRIRELVDAMVRLHESTHTTHDLDQLATIGRQIEATDRQIDELVYALYGLTNEEVRIVEEATAR